jgi:hypothetical protein
LLHVVPKCRLQGCAGLGKDAVHTGGIRPAIRLSGDAPDVRRRAADAVPRRRRRDLIREAIGFLLVTIAGRGDPELRLQPARGRLVADRTLLIHPGRSRHSRAAMRQRSSLM